MEQPLEMAQMLARFPGDGAQGIAERLDATCIGGRRGAAFGGGHRQSMRNRSRHQDTPG